MVLWDIFVPDYLTSSQGTADEREGLSGGEDAQTLECFSSC